MKLVVIEDHKLVREMLLMACGAVTDGVDARGASTGAEAVSLCRKFKPDLAFLDLDLPDGDGLDFLPVLRTASPATKIIALTSHTDEFTLHRALRAEIDGFVDKNEQPLIVLKEAVHMVLGGQTYYSSMAKRLRQAMREDPSNFSKVLTDHEQHLLSLFGDGLSNEAIAERAGVSNGHIRNMRSQIMGKLNIRSTAALMRYAMDKGFTRPRSPAPPGQPRPA